MEKTFLQPANMHQPFSTYSLGVTVEGAKRLIFCAGQVAADKDGNLIGEGDFEAQAEQVVANLKAVLAEAGATISDVVKATTFIVGREHAGPARELIRRTFDEASPPASTLCVLAGLADPRMLVEIEAIAVL